MASRVLDKKLKKVLDMRTDTSALLESLEAISTLFADGHNGSSGGAGGGGEEGGGLAGAGGGQPGQGLEYSTLDARRSLREDLEKQVRYQSSGCYVSVYSVVGVQSKQ